MRCLRLRFAIAFLEPWLAAPPKDGFPPSASPRIRDNLLLTPWLAEVIRPHPDGVDMQIRNVDVARCRRPGVARQAPGGRPELVTPSMSEGEGVATLADAG